MGLNSFCYSSKKGSFFEINEDYILFDIGQGLFSVADGFGGASRGDLASRQVLENVFNFYGKLSEDPESTKPFYFSPKYSLESNSLINAALYSHKQLFEKNLDINLGERAGCSAIFILIKNNFLNILSVGNLKLSMMRNGEISPLIIPDRIELDPSSELLVNFPMNSFGMDESMEFQLKEVPYKQGDCFLVTSSGVSAELSENFKSFVAPREGEPSALDFNFQEIFQKSQNLGNLNNQSALFLDFT